MQVLCLLPQKGKAVYDSPLGDRKYRHVKIHQSPSFLHVMAKCQLNSSSILLGSEPSGKGCILKLRNAFLLCLCYFKFYVDFIHMSNNFIFIYIYIMQVLFISICSQINRDYLYTHTRPTHRNTRDSLNENFLFCYINPLICVFLFVFNKFVRHWTNNLCVHSVF